MRIYIYIYIFEHIYIYIHTKMQNPILKEWFIEHVRCFFRSEIVVSPSRDGNSPLQGFCLKGPQAACGQRSHGGLCQTQKDRKVNWCELCVFLKDVTDVTFSFWGFLNIVASNKHMEISAYKIAQIYSSWAMCPTASAIFCPRIKKIPSQSCVTQLSDSICPSNWK